MSLFCWIIVCKVVSILEKYSKLCIDFINIGCLNVCKMSIGIELKLKLN